jgi:uncharacterized membrane protein YphA (DoxX/SURF4 family)
MAGELLLGLRWMLGVVFVTAGAMKVGASQSLQRSISFYGLVPDFLHRPVARSLPSLEICLGTAFILGILPTLAGGAASVLLLGFACGVAWNLLGGRRFECGCGRLGGTAITWGLVLRDLSLAAIAAAVAIGPSGSLAVLRGSSPLPSHPPASSELIPVPMTVILVLFVIRSLSARPSVWKPAPPAYHR